MKRFSFFLAMICLAVTTGYAQPNQLNAQFFHQPYLLNPALAGMEQGWSFFLGYAPLVITRPSGRHAFVGHGEHIVRGINIRLQPIKIPERPGFQLPGNLQLPIGDRFQPLRKQ